MLERYGVRLIPIFSFGLFALIGSTARADVMQIAADGTAQWRRGTGDVAWTSDTLHPPAAQPSAHSAYAPVLANAAAAQGLPPALLEAVIWQESRWNPSARSAKGALGLGQLMPATARALGVDPLDPVANLHGTARYLRQQLDQFGGNLPLALAAYNAGPRRVQQAGGIPAIAETRAYVRAINLRLGQTDPSLARGYLQP